MIKQLWTDRVGEGEAWQLEDVTSYRAPCKPHPPIWIAAISTESFAYAAKNGFNLMIVPYRQAERSGT
jgi:alkanesulfonate monooxygenase SsuD/methylene tetrahydromethanopterin reductase-like flavin-dependent oxidoreductase (luciferase family)